MDKMIKEAKTIYPVHDLIAKRWSARAFSEKSISEEALFTLLEAASWASSSINEQPWHYVYSFKGTPGFEVMWNHLSAGNQPWVKNASVLVMCVANKTFAKNGEFNRHYMHDVGMANANLLTQATSMGIYCHILGGYDRNLTDETFSIPGNREVICFIALGYLGDGDLLEEPFKTREITPRNRKSLQEISNPF
jgi:nitroreductase